MKSFQTHVNEKAGNGTVNLYKRDGQGGYTADEKDCNCEEEHPGISHKKWTSANSNKKRGGGNEVVDAGDNIDTLPKGAVGGVREDSTGGVVDEGVVSTVKKLAKKHQDYWADKEKKTREREKGEAGRVAKRREELYPEKDKLARRKAAEDRGALGALEAKAKREKAARQAAASKRVQAQQDLRDPTSDANTKTNEELFTMHKKDLIEKKYADLKDKDLDDDGDEDHVDRYIHSERTGKGSRSRKRAGRARRGTEGPRPGTAPGHQLTRTPPEPAAAWRAH